MITIHTSNLENISQKHGLTKKNIEEGYTKLPQHLSQIHQKKQGFYSVIDDTNIIKDIELFAKKIKGKYTDIVILGIGGSALGAICLRESLLPFFSKARKKKNIPNVHVIDNIDPTLMHEIAQEITLKKTLVLVVTKSGETPETIAQYFYIKQLYDKAKLPCKHHMVFITDSEHGLLRQYGNEEAIPMFDIPKNVGGRFSIQTAVGLLPAALMGINIKKFLQGFQDMRDSFLSKSGKKNLPFQLATIQYALSQKEKSINVLMPYSQKLIRFADWYRQLLAESIGKAKNNANETIHAGITPVNALGATDQHSQSQLYNEGPNDKFIIFIKVKKFEKTIPIPKKYITNERVSFLKNTSFNELINIELEATAQSYTQNNRPNITIEIDAVDEYHLGSLCMLFEGATAFLGEYFNINAFDQPGVELAKIKTKELLRLKG